jgi:nucleotide-binding universal stress UspA family protein
MPQEPQPRPVVVGVDASEESLRAVRFAADEGRLRAAPLRIVHALPAAFRDMTVPPGDLDVPGLLHSGAEGILQWAAEAVASRLPASAVSTSIVQGDPVGVLRAESEHAQLVVVGSRGVGGVAGLVLGSTASGLAGQTDCPLIVLPDHTAWVSDRTSVVVGVEGRSADDDVLDLAFAEVVARRTELVAASLTAQLLVVGHHRHRALGSTTHAVLHRATCPVAVVPIAASAG